MGLSDAGLTQVFKQQKVWAPFNPGTQASFTEMDVGFNYLLGQFL
jgi:hypothetical protein